MGKERDPCHEEPLPKAQAVLCPQFVPVLDHWQWIRVYCFVPGFPGRRMIPSIEQFLTFCTSGRFRECPAFVVPGDVEEAAGSPTKGCST